MGARQSKRSVDITTTPKKEGGANSVESAVIGDAAAPGDGKLERIEESDVKPTTNGIALHTDLTEDKDKDKDEATEKDKDLQQSEERKSENATKQQESSVESPEGGEVTTPTEANPVSPNVATAASSPDSKEPKKKDKIRKKWSLRSISFSKKDKSKPTREEAPKNGDVAKEEPLAEGGEEGENVASSPAEEKSTASSPSENENNVPLSSSVVESNEESVPSAAMTATTDTTKETITTTITAVAESAAAETTTSSTTSTTETAAAATAEMEAEAATITTTATTTTTTTTRTTATTTTTTTPPPPPPSASGPIAEEKKEEPTPTAPIPVLLEDKTEEPEKVETEKNVVEVSPAADGRSVVANPVEVSVFRVEPLETSSIIERKTSEDLLAYLPSSPPPTPIEPSPLEQRDRQTASATAAAKVLVEALNFPPVDAPVDAPVDVPVPPVLDPFNIDPPPPPPPGERSANPSSEGPSPEINSLLANRDSSSSPTLTPAAKDKLESDNELEPECESERVFLETASSATEKSNRSDRDVRQSETVVRNAGGSEEPEESKEPKEPKEQKRPEKLAGPEKFEKLEGNDNVTIKVEEIPSDDAVAIADELRHDFEEAVVEPGKDDVNENEQIVSNNDEENTKVENDGGVTVSLLIDATDDYTKQELLVEAKPAIVIPSEEIKEDDESGESGEEVVEGESKIDDSNEVTESVEVILPEDRMESEFTSKTAATPIEVFEVDSEPPFEDIAVESIEQPISETIAIVEKLVDGSKDVVEIVEIENRSVPPSPILESMTDELDVSSAGGSTPLPQYSPPSVQIASTNGQIPPATVIPEEIFPTVCPLRAASSEFPLPPKKLSSSLPRSSDNENFSLHTESTTKTTTMTTTTTTTTTRAHLTSSSTDSYQLPLQSSTSNAIDVTTAMSDRSQILSYDDTSDRKFKTESMSPSLDSYDHSKSESKERLAHSPAETEKGEEISSRRSFNDDASTAIQENHQSSEKNPESEAPVEKSIPREIVKASMESVEEVAPKVTPAPPIIPIEVPATPPPSVPAITEDVASVTKVIEEIDISDKAVAAAVNEAIECNTNEIIADAHHQNMNE